ncbi:hypothetical protein Vretimale_7254, partial [Volvox reticuliferus]
CIDADATGNLVHIALAVWSEAAALLRSLLNQAALLQLLQNVAHNAARSLRVVLRLGATNLVAAAILNAEQANTHVLAEVQLAGNRRSAHVVPVGVIGGQLLERARLHNIYPTGQLNLIIRLQMLGVVLNKIFRRHILNALGLVGSHVCDLESNVADATGLS